MERQYTRIDAVRNVLDNDIKAIKEKQASKNSACISVTINTNIPQPVIIIFIIEFINIELCSICFCSI